MAVAVDADGVAGARDSPKDIRCGAHLFAEDEERRVGSEAGQRVQHRGGRHWVGAIIKG